VSHSNPVSEAENPGTPLPSPVDPKKNPSYPARTHLHEKPKWLGVLKDVEDRVEVRRQKLGVLGGHADRPTFERLFAQMLGARDQVLDAVKRLPQETGDLYEEDHHRIEEAVAALGRVEARWDTH
jgi:hypothetical protein